MHLRQDKVIPVKAIQLLCLLAPLLLLHYREAKAQEGNSKSAAYMGVGSCSSSNCHGSVSPRNATNVIQNEYVTWEKHDLHSKAWLNLSNEQSKRIAYNLGISSAEKEPWCLSCHATYLGKGARLGSNYHIEDGVGCESCHGAAENYLGPHTANDSTREENIKNGMTDIVDYEKRMKLCGSCHFGDESKSVTHRLIGAGHPRLTFELDTYSMIEPKHWVVDEDYKKRKSDYDSARAWLSGQLQLAKLTLDRLGSATMSKDGIFPELTMFSCYACHHSLVDEQWKTHEYNGRPGELQLNLSSLVIVREAFKSLDPALSLSLGKEIEALHGNYKKGSVNEIKALEQKITSARNLLAKTDLNKSTLNKILKNMLSFSANSLNTQYELAEQVAMGSSAILASLSADDKLFKQELDGLYAALSDPRTFKLAEFVEASKKFEAAL